MTSVGDKQSSLCPDGETEAEAPLIFGKGGASHQLLQSIHLPHEGVSGTGVPSRPPLRAYIHQDIAASSWVTWAQSPSTPDTAQEHPPPPQLLEGVLGSGGCSPSLLSLPAHVCLAQKGSFLAPGLFSCIQEAQGYSREGGSQGGRRTWKHPRGLWLSCVPLAKVLGLIEEASAAMQGGDEEDAILVLQLVVQLSQQFPVGIINQDQDSRPHTVSLDE